MWFGQSEVSGRYHHRMRIRENLEVVSGAVPENALEGLGSFLSSMLKAAGYHKTSDGDWGTYDEVSVPVVDDDRSVLPLRGVS